MANDRNALKAGLFIVISIVLSLLFWLFGRGHR